MAKIIILGEGSAEGKQNYNKGKLFETLTKEILGGFGYNVTNLSCSVNYSGMEIDVEGNRVPDNSPFIGECKAWKVEIPAEPIRDFFGKYMVKWLKDNRLQGVFIALPNIGSSARGFYNDGIKDEKKINFSLIEEPQLLKQIYKSGKAISEETLGSIVRKVTKENLGDAELLYTKRGLFWIQYVIKPGETLPSKVMLADSKGTVITDAETIKYIQALDKRLEAYDFINEGVRDIKRTSLKDEQEIVSIQGSSSCFEYQFPASPAFFFGRGNPIKECITVISEIKSGKISSRGPLILAHSGWGKSSLILKLAEVLQKENTFLIPIDSRTATNQEFCLKAVDYAIKQAIKRKHLNGTLNGFEIGGFGSLLQTLKKVGSELEKSNKSILIFFDQFENVFFQKEILERIYNLVAILNECPKNILVGFSWKSDLISMTEDFPYQLRDEIRKQCKVVILPFFGEIETTAILKVLEQELEEPLIKKLSLLIREYSQGFPWLLKKLCAHIIIQRTKGVNQLNLVNSMLNIRELFDQDLSELSPDEEEALRHIAKRAPVLLSEMSEGYPIELLQSLIDKRLIVRVGQKFDIYWDIFRDYLNTGILPTEDSYILRLSAGGVWKALLKIREKKTLNFDSAHRDLGYTASGTAYNVIRELRVLDLIIYQNDNISLLVSPGNTLEDFNVIVRNHIKEKLRKHKTVSAVLRRLEVKKELSLNWFARFLEKLYPYIKADADTWLKYAKNFSTWMDYSDLVIYSKKEQIIKVYDPKHEVRSKKSLLNIRPSTSNIPSIQYDPLEKTIASIGDAIKNKHKIAIATSVSSWKKSLRDAIMLRFISIESEKIKFLPDGIQFYNNPQKRHQIFSKAVSSLDIYKTFLIIYKKSKGKLSVKALAKKLNTASENRWTKETSVTLTKILINWSKVTGLYEFVKTNK